MIEPHRLLDIPPIDSPHNDEHGWKYGAVAALERANRADIDGTADETPSVRELIARRANNVNHDQHWVLALVGSAPAGWASLSLPTDRDLDKAQLHVCVDPGMRRQGIGSALLSWCETQAGNAGRTLMFAETAYGPGQDHEPYVETVHGGRVPARTPSVLFSVNRGYEIAHAARRSVLDLPMDSHQADVLLAATQPYTSGYRLHTWFCEIPQMWTDPFARLKEAFFRDAPMGEVPFDEEIWGEEQVGQLIREILDQGKAVLMTAAEQVATGELVGFTELRWPLVPDVEAASQWFTVVSENHRGHRLGMWMKLVNMTELRRRCPQISRIHTDNAQENAPMLGINHSMGFRPDGGIALLKKQI